MTNADRSGCPCTVEGIEPCRSSCSCANPIMSGGCDRCAKYGSLEQRQRAARQIIAALRHPVTVYSHLTQEQFDQLEADAMSWRARQPSNDQVLVPRVPTLAMLEAGRISQSFGDEELDLDDMRFKWNAMLAAAEAEGTP